MHARTARGRAAWTALGVLLAVFLSAGPVAAAPADGQAPADRVAELSARLTAVQAVLDQAHADSALALEEYQLQQARVETAQAAAAQAAAVAAQAQADLGEAEAAMQDFARHSFMSHSSYPGATALLDAGSPGQLVERSALLDAVGTHRSDEVTRYAAARQQSGAASAAADQALAAAAAQQQLAADVLTRAEDAERNARQQATALATEQAALLAELTGLGGIAPGTSPGTPGADPVARTEAGPASPARVQAAIAAALGQLGVPYSWGGGGASGPGSGIGPDADVVGFDCSALTQYAYGRTGVRIPRTSREQFTTLPKVTRADLQPGDLAFWADDPADPATIHHVAMYLGGGKVVQAPESGDVVKVSDIWWSGYAGAVRPSP